MLGLPHSGDADMTFSTPYMSDYSYSGGLDTLEANLVRRPLPEMPPCHVFPPIAQ